MTRRPRRTATPFPPYSYVPGQYPHPHSDPAGHRFGADLPAPAAFAASRWADCALYLLGIDLLNAGYYWEAHEAWEKLWHAAGRRGPAATLLKALIQLAVVGVKVRQQMPDAARAHAVRAAQLLREVRAEVGDALLGLALEPLAAQAAALAEHPPQALPGAGVEVVFPFAIELLSPADG